MYMRGELILFLAFVMFLLCPLVSSELGKFKQNECINIVVPLNASSVTLTNVNSPINSTIILQNKAMSGSNNFFNYTFCNTSQLGTYTYGYCDQDGNCYGNTFVVNGSGQDVSQSQIILILIGLCILLITGLFFFILSLLFKHPGTKIFLMALSALTLIVLIGIITSNATVYLAEFPGLVNMYNNYYILVITLAGVSMLGIIVWLVYYSFTLFSKSRGTLIDED